MTSPQFPGSAGQGVQPAPDGGDRSVAILTHLAAIIAVVISVGWLGFVGPLLMWFVYKDKSPFVRQAAAGAFNFNLSMWVLSVLGWIFFITFIGIPIAIVLWAVAAIATLWCSIRGALRANGGHTYRYPMQIRILS